MVDAGQKLPAFSLLDETGRPVTNKDYAGKRFVLFIYPKADTTGCTKEACAFRDDAAKFAKKGVPVIGLSKDTASAQKRFREKYSLAHPLLADPERAYLKALGVIKPKTMYGKKVIGTVRTTFLVGTDGRVEKVWSPVQIDGHVEDVLASL